MTYLVYILKSLNTGKLYIGQCADMPARFLRHNQGLVPSTRFGVPWEVIYTESYSTRGEAMIREKYLKSLKSPSYLMEKIVIGGTKRHMKRPEGRSPNGFSADLHICVIVCEYRSN